MAPRLLAGDLGGTKLDLALYDGPVELERKRYRSRDYVDLASVAQSFLAGRTVDAAAFAVAGPVHDGRSKITNLPWELDERVLAQLLGTKVVLLNDLAGSMFGATEVDDRELVWLARGEPENGGVLAAIGAGTGLGEAVAVRTPAGLTVLPSEGGHADFAARNEVELELWRFFRRRVEGRVSLERALSGPGLVAIYEFAVEQGLGPRDPETARQMLAGDPAEVIARRSRPGEDLACERALSIFVGLYGAEAGNLALKVLPTGGLYLVGGIAPKLIERLERGDFMDAFLDKGRMADVLRRIPVAVVMCADVALRGARARADVLYSTG